MLRYTKQSDPEIAALVEEELTRQEHNIEMIASESTAPLEVMELSGSVFTNKTLEGYPENVFRQVLKLRIRLRDWLGNGQKNCSVQNM